MKDLFSLRVPIGRHEQVYPEDQCDLRRSETCTAIDDVSIQGTNGSIWSLIAMYGYIQAQVRGEELAELKQARGRGGGSKA